ncbi:hypothetical protein RHSIM_Rhsim11G0145700 [Rhododendron simsii]|uniref:Tf2-1-like SH3-like domain-containing protein n=1 Tax=Rhododendron simsii TaxID=118357 RepID=A0A834G6X5_RHOSS|nr:hypothetical protein RHSIM_Rhsim11G0145700 [Rhododendron simsii]
MDPKLANPNPPELKAPTNSFTSYASNSPTYMLFKTLTPKEMDARRAKGLCFNCDERFVKGHRCQKKQLYVITGDEEEEDDTGQDNPGVEEATLEDEVHISVHALAGSNSFRTMRVVGTVKGKEMVILIDSGSTHNFIDPRVAKIYGIMVEQTPDLTVTVVDGTRLCSKGWLSTLGPIVWDFKNLKMQFNWLAKPFLLEGNTQCKVEQQKWLTKLLGYDYEIVYKAGHENKVANALSRLGGDQDTMAALTVVQADWLVVGSNKHLRLLILGEVHGSPERGRSVVCDTYQRNKTETVASPRLLRPLPIPERIWTKISMDFMERLPVSQGKSVIFVVVDRLSKYVHFMALSHPYTSQDVAKNLMKQQANKHMFEREFELGDWVYLRLQPYKRTTLQARSNLKLCPRFYGPFQVIKRIGKVAYQLNLPPHSKLHPVFHVSLLKKKLGSRVVAHPTIPPVSSDGVLKPQLVAVLDRRLVKYKRKLATQVLIQWSGSFPEDATWEFYHELLSKFPKFQPWGQGPSQGAGHDTCLTMSDQAKELGAMGG